MQLDIKELSESCHTYAELSERTIANHEDLEATFEDFNIDVEELFDYIEENKKPLDRKFFSFSFFFFLSSKKKKN